MQADLRIDARWVLPMDAEGSILEHHSVYITDGRIVTICPTAEARCRRRGLPRRQLPAGRHGAADPGLRIRAQRK